jgi:transposase-like protein
VRSAAELCSRFSIRTSASCRKEGINENLYYRWSKEFLEAGRISRTVFSALSGMRLLPCLIVAPRQSYTMRIFSSAE